MALRFLPLLLPEAPLHVQSVSMGKGRKHGTWRPTMLETMTFFVDVQPVNSAFLFYYYLIFVELKETVPKFML
jgi:hypothetical protein